MSYPRPETEVTWIDTKQMIEVDRAMMEDYQISLVQMMENAGRTLAQLARARFLANDPRGKHVVVLAGSGGNGGGAITCARRLACWGAQVTVAVTKAESMTKVPGRQLEIVRKMGVDIISAEALETLPAVDLVIDGIIGYSLSGAPRGPARIMIEWANRRSAPCLALDAPSGLDAASGRVFEPAIRATATMTLALPKVGLRSTTGREHVGELYLADISVPPQLYAGPGLELDVGPIFARSDIVALEVGA